MRRQMEAFVRGIQARHSWAARVAAGAALCAGVFAGCAPALPEAQLERVDPTWGYNGEETAIEIVGTQLLPAVVVHAGEEGGGRVDAQFQVWLENDNGRFSVSGVELLDYRRLAGVVPAGHTTGRYDVELLTPGGQRVVLEDAFTLQDTRADHMVAEVDSVVQTVNDMSVVRLSLADPDGETVPDDIRVSVRVESDLEAQGVIFQQGGLTEQVELEDGVGVQGRLFSDGTGYVVLSSAVPDDLEVVVESLETDQVIREDSVRILYTTGDARDVTVLLPGAGFVATAGEEFVVMLGLQDAFGNPVEDEPGTIWLFEECGDYREQVTFGGTFPHALVLEQASSADCPVNRLVAAGEASGTSVAFSVAPGAVESLTVFALQSSVVAGEVLGVLVGAQDAYGNAVGLTDTNLSFQDTVGGVGSSTCTPASGEGLLYCEIVLEIASEAVLVMAEDSEGHLGLSGAVEILPAGPAALEVVSIWSPVVAGSSFGMEVRVVDFFGNAVPFQPEGADPIAVDDGTGNAPCAYVGETSAGVYGLECVLEIAAQAQVLSVSVPSLGVAAATAPFTVDNGVLAVVDMVLSRASLVAGELVDATLVGFDAYGNAYIVQSDPVVLLSDSVGGITETPVTLAADGTGEALGLQPVGAGDPVVVRVSQGGVVLGEASLVVEAGPLDSLEVEAAQTWTWLGDSLGLEVRGVDAYGNPVPDFVGPVTLSSEQGAALVVSVADFVGGVGEGSMTWDTAQIGDRVQGQDALGTSGTSGLLDALDPSCPDAPTASLLVEGQAEHVDCLVGGSVTLGLDFSGSTIPAGRTLAAYHLSGDGVSQRTMSDSFNLKKTREGAFLMGLVVADDAGCGSQAEATLWLANQDDSVAGPVSVTAAASQVTAGSATNGTTGIDVSAQDCEGDVAAGQTLYVRTNLGDLVAGPSATGVGLALVLDASGQGTFDLDLSSSLHGGTSSVETGTLNGASWGGVDVEVLGDNALPWVVAVDPMGQTAEIFSQVVVGFSEGMRGSSIQDATVVLSGPSGVVAWDSLALDADGSVLTGTLLSAQDAAAGTYTLSVLSSVSDAGGNNPLSGDYSGGGADYVGRFGAVADEGISVLSCLASTVEIVPDGDDGGLLGLAEEADRVEVTVEASNLPTEWWLEVTSLGERVYSFRQVATAATEVLAWEGRGLDGAIAAPGAYTVGIATVDAHDNVSAPCEIVLELKQHYQQPEVP